MPRQGWKGNSKDIYAHNAAMFSSKCETFVLQVAYAWMVELFSKLGAQVHVKKTRKFLWFELATVTPQAQKFDVINFCRHVQASLFKIW